MGKYQVKGFSSGEILLPSKHIDISKWAVIACDQFTSQMDYWKEVEKTVGRSPSALKITLPEAYLSRSEALTEKINANMIKYMAGDVLETAVTDGFVLVDRVTTQGHRLGLVGMIDLEEYSFAPGDKSLVRPTEKTIPERVPPRAKIRENADIELSHVMMLIDDYGMTLNEVLYANRADLRQLYDFNLMMDGGHITGYAVEGSAAEYVVEALNALYAKSSGLLYAVGDGNHSLAAAKACWEDKKRALSGEEIADHPARFAMVEIVNIHCDALVFEPIHRFVKGVNGEEFIYEYASHLRAMGADMRAGDDVRAISSSGEVEFGFESYPLYELQEFLNGYANSHKGVDIDYIHGARDLRRLVSGGGAGFLLKSINKSALFGYIRQNGVLPRKAFSMGEARDKRYYLEARKIVK